jgi:CheY-like chemotaxis protein
VAGVGRSYDEGETTEVVAQTATGPEAMHQVLEHRPDLVLRIYLQREMDGLEAVHLIQVQALIHGDRSRCPIDEIRPHPRSTHPAGFLPKPVCDYLHNPSVSLRKW